MSLPKLNERVARGIAVALIVLGAVLRLRQFLAMRSLWLDEASLALNIASRSYGDLAKPLDMAQVAPIPYLWIERLFCDLFGVNEAALRMPSLLAGIALMWFAWRVARRALDEVSALVALALVAVSPTLIYYSNEAKPYSIDALASVGIVWLATRVLEAPAQRARWIALGVGGSLAVSVAFPAVLVLPGVALALLLTPECRAHARFWPWSLAVGAAWTVAFGLSYASVQNAAANAYLQQFWEGMFFPTSGPDWASRLWTGLTDSLQQAFVGAQEFPNRKLQVTGLLVLAIGAAVALVRQRRAWAAVLLGLPLVTAFVAALLQRYPFAARTVLFQVPLFFVLLAGAAGAVTAWLPKRELGVAAVGVLLVAPGLWTDAPRFAQPKRREDTRPALEQVQAARTAGEPLYVYARSIPAWAIYSTDWQKPDHERLAFILGAATEGGPSFENTRSRGRAVEREGDTLEWAGPKGPELLGLATGVNLRPNVTVPRRIPDDGWAANEARRLRANGASSAWLFFSHVVDGADGQLIAALTAQGARVIQTVQAEGAVAHRLQLPAAADERRAEESNLTP